MRPSLHIVKAGGHVIEDPAALQGLLAGFSALAGRKILVHGGGPAATRLAAALGLETRLVSGRRITDAPTLRIATMVYGGLINKTLTVALQGAGIDAVGLTGADADLIRSDLKPGFGFAGTIREVRADRLATLLEAGLVPVLAPLTHDGRGQLLNTNADGIAAALATALADRYAVTLRYCFEQPGVLRDPADPSTLIPVLTAYEAARLIADGTLSGGMVPKVENALDAAARGIRVRITSAAALDGGTLIQPD